MSAQYAVADAMLRNLPFTFSAWDWAAAAAMYYLLLPFRAHKGLLLRALLSMGLAVVVVARHRKPRCVRNNVHHIGGSVPSLLVDSRADGESPVQAGSPLVRRPTTRSPPAQAGSANPSIEGASVERASTSVPGTSLTVDEHFESLQVKFKAQMSTE